MAGVETKDLYLAGVAVVDALRNVSPKVIEAWWKQLLTEDENPGAKGGSRRDFSLKNGEIRDTIEE